MDVVRLNQLETPAIVVVARSPSNTQPHFGQGTARKIVDTTVVVVDTGDVVDAACSDAVADIVVAADADVNRIVLATQPIVVAIAGAAVAVTQDVAGDAVEQGDVLHASVPSTPAVTAAAEVAIPLAMTAAAVVAMTDVVADVADADVSHVSVPSTPAETAAAAVVTPDAIWGAIRDVGANEAVDYSIAAGTNVVAMVPISTNQLAMNMAMMACKVVSTAEQWIWVLAPGINRPPRWQMNS